MAAIFVAAILLRFAGLGAQSVWLDEAVSVRVATPVLEPVDANHPPLYYIMLYYTMSALGRSEAAIRLPSALISVLNVGLLYLLGRRLVNREVALLAAALLALSPLDIWYAREARMYTAIAFVTLLMALGLAWRHWAGFALFFIGLSAGLYLSYLIPPIWMALSAVWLVYWFRKDRPRVHLLLWLAASAGAWWLYRPWLPVIGRWAQNTLLRHWMFEHIRDFLGASQLSPLHFGALVLVVTAGLVGVALAAPSLLGDKRRRKIITVLTIAGFVAIVLVVPIPRVYAAKRILVTAWALVILFVAWLVWQNEQLRVTLARLLLGLSLVSSLVTVLFVPKDDWRGVTAYMGREAPDATVWVDPLWNNIAYSYYRPQQEVLHKGVGELQEIAVQHDELWLVAERFHGKPVPSSPSEAWMNENMELVEAIPFYRLELRYYRAAR